VRSDFLITFVFALENGFALHIVGKSINTVSFIMHVFKLKKMVCALHWRYKASPGGWKRTGLLSRKARFRSASLGRSFVRQFGCCGRRQSEPASNQ
jgi:hypothetical protein